MPTVALRGGGPMIPRLLALRLRWYSEATALLLRRWRSEPWRPSAVRC